MKYLVIYWDEDKEKWVIDWWGTNLRIARHAFNKCKKDNPIVRMVELKTLKYEDSFSGNYI